jgi:hypothetical protein
MEVKGPLPSHARPPGSLKKARSVMCVFIVKRTGGGASREAIYRFSAGKPDLWCLPMRMTQIALTLTVALLAVTGYLAWEGQQAAKGAREELKFIKSQQAAMGVDEEGAVIPATRASASITPPAPQPPAAVAASAPVPPPLGGLPTESELMAGSGALPGGGLTVPKAVAEAEAAGINTNTLTPAQKQVFAAKPIAKVKTVVKEQGFIVVEGGSKQGISKGMTLQIRRGAAVLGRATVTDAVEEAEAVADLDFSSIPAGVTIEPGDDLIQPVSP